MPIRLLLCVLLWGLTFSASACWAATPGPYLEAEGYGTWLLDSQNQTNTGSFNAAYKEGTGWGLALGYDFAAAYPALGRGRLELEAASRRSPVKDLAFVEGQLPAAGHVTVRSLMANTLGEYHNGTIWVPYVALGAGYAEVSISQTKAAGSSFIASSSAGVFAYQVGAGMGIALGDHLTVDIGYRYFATLKPKLKLADGSRFQSEIASHNLLLGLRFTY